MFYLLCLKDRKLAESANQIGFFEVTSRVNGFFFGGGAGGETKVIMFQIAS